MYHTSWIPAPTTATIQRPETPCRPSKGVPSERLRLVEVILISHRLTIYWRMCKSCVTYLTYLLHPADTFVAFSKSIWNPSILSVPSPARHLICLYCGFLGPIIHINQFYGRLSDKPALMTYTSVNNVHLILHDCDEEKRSEDVYCNTANNYSTFLPHISTVYNYTTIRGVKNGPEIYLQVCEQWSNWILVHIALILALGSCKWKSQPRKYKLPFNLRDLYVQCNDDAEPAIKTRRDVYNVWSDFYRPQLLPHGRTFDR